MPARKPAPPPPPGLFPPPFEPYRRRRKRKQSPTTKLKRKIAKVTGIPTTASGRKKKAERLVCDFLIDKLDKLDK
ncbi:MAG: hypothetical protein IKQ91_04245 [Oscillospiraceae bacterium]|nr:hypothetical protein [Oscillospiraceae bacterium]